MNDFALKIGSDTNPVTAANAIATQVLTGNAVSIDAIGVAANYSACKTLIHARKKLLQSGISIAYQPSFKDVAVKKDLKTAINWEVVVLKK